jgi:hypothetical protein
MKRSKLRFLAAVVALAFMLVVSPQEVKAEDDMLMMGCFACGDCHQDLWCTGCGVYTLYAISGCCGMGSGTAYCMQEWGGYAVGCSSGSHACQCNTTGGNCAFL